MKDRSLPTLDTKSRKYRLPEKPLRIKAGTWKYLGTSKYRDSLDKLFGKEKRYRGKWTTAY